MDDMPETRRHGPQGGGAAQASASEQVWQGLVTTLT